MTASCWVPDLKRQVAVFTGRLVVNGQSRTQAECGALLKSKGGSWRGKPSVGVTVVVRGDLTASSVIDPDRGYSEKLVYADDQRRQGHHVHVIDAEGITDLLNGQPARCRQLKRSPSGEVHVLPDADEEVFGPPFSEGRRVSSRRPPRALAVDLDALDHATAAHEETVEELSRTLAAAGIGSFLPSRSSPRFDLGWRIGKRIYVAEVKSLTGAEQHQQVRLGIGQVLDYKWQLHQGGKVVHPVLVLERVPRDERWKDVANSVGIVLACAPSFEGLNL